MRSRASCARSSVSQRTTFDGYVTHFGHRVQGEPPCARRAAGRGRARALAAPAARLPGWFASDADVTRATIAAGRGDYDAASNGSDRVRGAVAVEPRCRMTTAAPDPRAGRGRPPRSCPRRWWTSALAARPALASGARLLALRAWLRSLDGDEAGALADVQRAWEEAGDGTQHLLRRERPRLEPLLWTALERGVLAPEASSKRWMPPGPAAPPLLAAHPSSGPPMSGAPPSWPPSRPDIPARSHAPASCRPIPIPRWRHAARVGARALGEPAAARFTVLGGFAPAPWRVRDRRRSVAAPRRAAARTHPAHAPRRGDGRGRAVRGAVAGQGRGSGAPQPPGDRVGRARRLDWPGTSAQRPAW